MTLPLRRFSVFVTAIALIASARGQLVGVSGSVAAAPTELGGFTLAKFNDDARALFGSVSNVSAADGGQVNFSTALSHRKIGQGWMTWSNGYTGDVYVMTGATSLTLTLPSLTQAFYFYAEPQSFSSCTFSVASGGVTLEEVVGGLSGAELFAFYSTDNSAISTITITATDQTGFAIGEFGLARAAPVPEASTGSLLGIGLLGGLILVRQMIPIAKNR